MSQITDPKHPRYAASFSATGPDSAYAESTAKTGTSSMAFDSRPGTAELEALAQAEKEEQAAKKLAERKPSRTSSFFGKGRRGSEKPKEKEVDPWNAKGEKLCACGSVQYTPFVFLSYKEGACYIRIQ